MCEAVVKYIFHQRQGPGQQSLFHVLRAYSAHDRQVRMFCIGQV
jgi:hypothetical protein